MKESEFVVKERECLQYIKSLVDNGWEIIYGSYAHRREFKSMNQEYYRRFLFLMHNYNQSHYGVMVIEGPERDEKFLKFLKFDK